MIPITATAGKSNKFVVQLFLMTGKLTPQQIEDMLASQYIAKLACCAQNKPYVVPINYVYDGEAIFSRTTDGMKIEMMRQNPEVCILVDDIKTLTHWKSVIGWGRFRELSDPIERKEALSELHKASVESAAGMHARLTPEWPFTPGDMDAVEGIVYKIELTEKTGRFEQG